MTPVAFYGGSFDPPHVAHVLAVAYLAGMGQFDRVLVVPVFRHAFEKRLTPFGERLRMCELAVGWLPGVEVTGVAIEGDRRRGRPELAGATPRLGAQELEGSWSPDVPLDHDSTAGAHMEL